MNKWEREVFLPKLEKRPMSEKAFDKIARPYDRKHHDKTRLTFNAIHESVSTINKVYELVSNSEVKLQVDCPTPYKMSEKWARNEFFEELKSGPMTQKRFDTIMNEIGSDYTRKYYDEFNLQREIANKIWTNAACSSIKEKAIKEVEHNTVAA